MTFKEFLFAVINFAILAGGLFFILRKMVARMLKERRDKIEQELKTADEAQDIAVQAAVEIEKAERVALNGKMYCCRIPSTKSMRIRLQRQNWQKKKRLP